MIYVFFTGFLAGCFAITMVIWFGIGKNRKEFEHPFPLNPELVEFWRRSIEQKDIELKFLDEIRDALKGR